MRPAFSLCSGLRWSMVMLLAFSVSVFAEQPTNTPPAESSTNVPAEKPSRSVYQELESLFINTGSIPTNFPDAETFIYRDLKPEPLHLFVVKPVG